MIGMDVSLSGMVINMFNLPNKDTIKPNLIILFFLLFLLLFFRHYKILSFMLALAYMMHRTVS